MSVPDAADRVRIAGAVPGDSADPHNNSGTVAALFEALSRHGLLARRLDVGISRGQRYRLAVSTFHPIRPLWQARFRRAVYETQSRNCERLIADDGEPNVILQMFRGFHARGLPYWLFLDTTDSLRRAAGREGPFGPDGIGYSSERSLYAEAEHIFVMAAEPRSSLVTDYGIEEGSVTVVGAGVNIAYPDTLGTLGDLARYRQRTVLFVGRDFERKGGKDLLGAFERVQSVVPDARLLVAGVTLPDDPPGVRSVGEVVNRRRLVELYEQASVFCLPSLFEPTGMSIMEAMAYGLPVVGTGVGGIPEAVSEDTGILVAAGNVEQLAAALARLLTDPEEASRMGHHGRRLIDTERNWDAVVDRMLSAVRRTAGH